MKLYEIILLLITIIHMNCMFGMNQGEDSWMYGSGSHLASSSLPATPRTPRSQEELTAVSQHFGSLSESAYIPVQFRSVAMITETPFNSPSNRNSPSADFESGSSESSSDNSDSDNEDEAKNKPKNKALTQKAALSLNCILNNKNELSQFGILYTNPLLQGRAFVQFLKQKKLIVKENDTNENNVSLDTVVRLKEAVQQYKNHLEIMIQEKNIEKASINKSLYWGFASLATLPFIGISSYLISISDLLYKDCAKYYALGLGALTLSYGVYKVTSGISKSKCINECLKEYKVEHDIAFDLVNRTIPYAEGQSNTGQLQ